MRGLEGLPALRSLWLGSNRIPAVCDALVHNAALEELNLSGNLVSNFKDVPNLARMRKPSVRDFNRGRGRKDVHGADPTRPRALCSSDAGLRPPPRWKACDSGRKFKWCLSRLFAIRTSAS